MGKLNEVKTECDSWERNPKVWLDNEIDLKCTLRMGQDQENELNLSFYVSSDGCEAVPFLAANTPDGRFVGCVDGVELSVFLERCLARYIETMARNQRGR